MNEEETKLKHVYVSTAESVYKILLLRGFDLGEKMAMLDPTLGIDTKCKMLWGSTKTADFSDIKEVFSFAGFDNDPQTNPTKPLANLVRYVDGSPPRDIVTFFVGKNGAAAGTDLISYLRNEFGDGKTDIILVTEKKLSSQSATAVAKMAEEPELPRIWHFTYQDMSKFIPENTFFPRMIAYKDRELIVEMCSRYGTPDEMPKACIDAPDVNIYGLVPGDMFFIRRSNLDPAGFANWIPQIRIVSDRKMPNLTKTKKK